MKPNFCILSIIFAILVLIINQTVIAQSDNFKTYTNTDMKFSIIHPSNWLVKEDEESPHETVSFELSDRTRSIFVIHISEVEPYLDTSTMTLKNTSLEQYVQQQQDVLSSLDINYNLVRQNEVTVGGNVGIKVEYTAGIFYTSQVYTIANGKLYSLLYADYPLKVPETLPLANKMVESFQIKR